MSQENYDKLADVMGVPHMDATKLAKDEPTEPTVNITYDPGARFVISVPAHCVHVNVGSDNDLYSIVVSTPVILPSLP